MNFKVCIGDLPVPPYIERRMIDLIDRIPVHYVGFGPRKVSLNEFGSKFDLSQFIEIASIESLFNPKAFEHSKERIIGEPEIEPKNQVDLDPIVLFRTKHGYLIITAWGDEANDELILNEKLN